MSLFDRPVYCDECGAQFVVDDSRIGSIKKDDLEVQYLSCPSCGAKFLIFVSDSKMRSLVERRKAIQTKIKAAHAKRFKSAPSRSICGSTTKSRRSRKT